MENKPTKLDKLEVFLTDGASKADDLADLKELGVNIDNLLARVEDVVQYRQLIIESEAASFSTDGARELRSFLVAFVAKYRHSTNEDDQIAVGSAIRKYIATIPVEELASVLDLLGNKPVLIDVELEVVKMVVRKLTARPLENTDAMSDLSIRLYEIADAYLNGQFIERKKFGTVALNCVIAIILLGHQFSNEIQQRIVALESIWFKDAVRRRCRAICDELLTRIQQKAVTDTIIRLTNFESQIYESKG